MNERLQEIIKERTLATRFRQAVQFCKDTTGYSNYHTDRHMGPDDRMKMERCLTQNFLLKFGMDVFGKRDLLYIDMRGDQDVAKMHSMEMLPTPYKPPKEEKGKAAAEDEGGDDEGADGGDDGAADGGDDDE